MSTTINRERQIPLINYQFVHFDHFIKLLSGAGAGVISKTAFSPLERIRILCQLGETHGFLNTLKKIFKTEGISGYWKGNYTNCLRTVPSKGILFCCSDMYKDIMRDEKGNLSFWKYSVAGAGAGITAVTLTYPLDTIRVRILGQIRQIHSQSNIFSIGANIIRHEGLLGLYKGMTPTFLGTFPYMSIVFGVQGNAAQFLENLMESNDDIVHGVGNKTWVHALSGGIAGTIATAIMFPNDTVRRRIQNEQTNTGRNLIQWWKMIYHEGGIRTFYRGLCPQLIRSAPNMAMQFAAFNFIKQILIGYQ